MKQLTILAICFLSSCIPEPQPTELNTRGKQAIYLQKSELGEVSSSEPLPFSNLGKIVSSDDYIYINEKHEGIHVIDNTNPSNPFSVHFWTINGNIDFTIDGQFLYADDGFNLLTIDISDPGDIQVLSKIEDIYIGLDGLPTNSSLFPPDYFGLFECVDPAKGIVIDWQFADLINPKCRI